MGQDFHCRRLVRVLGIRKKCFIKLNFNESARSGRHLSFDKDLCFGRNPSSSKKIQFLWRVCS